MYYQVQAPAGYSQPGQQSQLQPSAASRKRQLPGSEIVTPSFPAIQPKPPGLSPAPYTPGSAEYTGSFKPSPGDSAGEPARKRRGRPSNAQIEQEKAAAAAEGREWQPRPPRPPRKKKSKPIKESPPKAVTEPSQQPVPETPHTQMMGTEEESSSGKRRRRKMGAEPAKRATPYDPVRQSPTEAAAFAGETPQPAPQQPLQPPFQPTTTTNSISEQHHSTAHPQMYSDYTQQMQTEQ
jgi:hypothetical protein